MTVAVAAFRGLSGVGRLQRLLVVVQVVGSLWWLLAVCIGCWGPVVDGSFLWWPSVASGEAYVLVPVSGLS